MRHRVVTRTPTVSLARFGITCPRVLLGAASATHVEVVRSTGPGLLREAVEAARERGMLRRWRVSLLHSRVWHPIMAEQKRGRDSSAETAAAINASYCYHHFVSSWVEHNQEKHQASEFARGGTAKRSVVPVGQLIRATNPWKSYQLGPSAAAESAQQVSTRAQQQSSSQGSASRREKGGSERLPMKARNHGTKPKGRRANTDPPYAPEDTRTVPCASQLARVRRYAVMICAVYDSYESLSATCRCVIQRNVKTKQKNKNKTRSIPSFCSSRMRGTQAADVWWVDHLERGLRLRGPGFSVAICEPPADAGIRFQPGMSEMAALAHSAEENVALECCTSNSLLAEPHKLILHDGACKRAAEQPVRDTQGLSCDENGLHVIKLEELPDEICAHIFSMLPPVWLARAAGLSRSLNLLAPAACLARWERLAPWCAHAGIECTECSPLSSKVELGHRASLSSLKALRRLEKARNFALKERVVETGRWALLQPYRRGSISRADFKRCIKEVADRWMDACSTENEPRVALGVSEQLQLVTEYVERCHAYGQWRRVMQAIGERPVSFVDYSASRILPGNGVPIFYRVRASVLETLKDGVWVD